MQPQHQCTKKSAVSSAKLALFGPNLMHIFIKKNWQQNCTLSNKHINWKLNDKYKKYKMFSVFSLVQFLRIHGFISALNLT